MAATTKDTGSANYVHRLSEAHREEIITGSAVSEDVAEERGYRTLRDTPENRAELKELRIPRWSWRDESAWPGLLLPTYGVTGEGDSCQWKPAVPQMSGDKAQKYASPFGSPNALDVPAFTRAALGDVDTPLYVTEGVKKADALVTQGQAAIGIKGVFNWRSRLGASGLWEDIPLKNRTVTICFDSDAHDNPMVLSAMKRFGAWLKYRHATPQYLIVPADVNGVPVKGVDDFFAAGGQMAWLDALTTTEPPKEDADARFTDAILADRVAEEAFDGQYTYVEGLGWMQWTGKVWKPSSEDAAVDLTRRYLIRKRTEAADAAKTGGPWSDAEEWEKVMRSAGRMRGLTGLVRGAVGAGVDAGAFDEDPDLLNCPNGIVDLRTGKLGPHDPEQYMTKMTGADYVRGATHPDWDKALQALPGDVRGWFQLRIGQALTGHMTPDDTALISQGNGGNGKSCVNDACAEAAGGYHIAVADRAMLGGASDNHPTEMMDFLGARYAVLEETAEARRLDTNRLKKLTGTREITARRIRQDSVTFEATHSLFVNTNHKPVVDETDHGTWRRLALLRWPYTFRKTADAVRGPMDRLGDPTLRQRVKANPEVREAVLSWMVEGARRWYELGMIMPPHPTRVEADTLAWRKESDVVLAFLDEFMTFDLDAHVIATELRTVFNAWLKEKGSHEWGDKTFVARFGGHDECSQHSVDNKYMKGNPQLSRPEGSGPWGTDHPAAKTAYTAWRGVRYLTPEERTARAEKVGDQDRVEPVEAENKTPAREFSKAVNSGDSTGSTAQVSDPEDDCTCPPPDPDDPHPEEHYPDCPLFVHPSTGDRA